MDKGAATDKILALVRKLEARAGQMKTNPVSKLDLDMSLRDTRELYDLLLSLDAEPGAPAMPDSATAQAQLVKMSLDKRHAEESFREQDPGAPSAQASKPATVSKSTDDAPEGQASSDRQRDRRQKVMSEANKPPATLFDEAPEEAPQSLHDKISQAEGAKSLAEKLASSPAEDLKQMIGINEKYKFVNALFDGNLKEYNDCIAKVNAAASLAEARGLLEEVVAGRFESDLESEAFTEITALLQKRFLI